VGEPSGEVATTKNEEFIINSDQVRVVVFSMKREEFKPISDD
jgi:hypothetical protein